MTMFARMGTAGLLALAVVLVGTSTSQADDVFRLNMTADTTAPAVKLGEIAPEADIFDVRGYGGGRGGGFRGGFRGGFHGGHHGFYGGHRGFYGGHHGFYGGHRGYYGGYGGYRGYYGGYRGYYGGYNVYRPIYSYNDGYCAPYSYYPSYYSYCPIGSAGLSAATFSLRIGPVVTQLQTRPMPYAPVPLTPAQPNDGSPTPMPNDGTFDYDGGPRAPVPMPKAEPVPMNTQPTVPLEGRPVSLPDRSTPKYTYPAYGEQPRNPAPTVRTIPVTTTANR